MRRFPTTIATALVLLGAGGFALTIAVGERQVAARTTRTAGEPPFEVRAVAPFLVRTIGESRTSRGFHERAWHLWLPGAAFEVYRGAPYCGGYALF